MKPLKPEGAQVTAAARTIPLFDKETLAAQADRSAPRFDGPRFRKIGVHGKMSVSNPPSTHLAREGSWYPLCGLAAMGEKGVPTGKVCRACLVEAGRLGGVLR